MPNGYQSTWTDERTAKAKRMWLNGASASEIAKALGGVSRNGVIGKMHRLGAKRSEEVVRTTYQRAMMRVNRERRQTERTPKPEKPKPYTPVFVAAAEPTIAIADHVRLRAVEVDALDVSIGTRGCKWPTTFLDGEQRFCGRERHAQRPYCLEHSCLAYRKADPTPVNRDRPPKHLRGASR